MLRDTHVLTVTVQVSSESALPFIHRKISCLRLWLYSIRLRVIGVVIDSAASISGLQTISDGLYK